MDGTGRKALRHGALVCNAQGGNFVLAPEAVLC